MTKAERIIRARLDYDTRAAHARIKRIQDLALEREAEREIRQAEDRIEDGQARWSETGSSRR